MRCGIGQQAANPLRRKLEYLCNFVGRKATAVVFKDGVSGHTRMLEDRDAAHLTGNGFDIGATCPVHDGAFEKEGHSLSIGASTHNSNDRIDRACFPQRELPTRFRKIFAMSEGNADSLTLSIYTPLLDMRGPMSTSSSVAIPGSRRRQSDLIRQIPSRNIHLGVRLARTIGLDLNLFVTFNFSLTSCDPECADRAFAQLRTTFRKWATRPPKTRVMLATPPTFVWVIENPNNCLNAHWLVHVPRERQAEFRRNLPKWFETAVGEVYSDRAIKVKPVTNAEGLKAYLLKGLHPGLARMFGIRHVNQGWVFGRRAGHSKNLGPVQVKKWRDLQLFPPARRWVNYPA